MQNFQDTATGRYWSLDDDVEVEVTESGRVFRNSGGMLLGDVPLTLEPIASIPTQEPPTLDQLRAAKEAEINAAYARAVLALAHGYPDAERETWPVQILESAAVLAGANTATTWIDAAAAARGITREELATKIRDMDAQYRQLSGALTGKRQALRDLVQAVVTPEELATIAWN